MNFIMKAGMNQMKDQAQALIPSELQDKKEENPNPDQKDSKEEIKVQKKPKKKSLITRGLAIKMYSILLFHTLVVTIVLFIFKKEITGFNILFLIIFFGCFCGSIILSLGISKIKLLSKVFLNYIFYLVLLAANIIGFTCLANTYYNLFELILTMFIVFDAGSLTIILFSLIVKDTPSTFWLMCSCTAGIIIAILVMSKIYNTTLVLKIFVLVFSVLSFAIYESMNYNAFNEYQNTTKEIVSSPSLISLPYELNVCFIKVFWYIIKGIFSVFSMCCSLCSTKKKK